MKKLKPIPKFKDEAEERLFWQTADSSEYLDYSKFHRARFPNLRLSTSPITIRLPDSYIDRLKLQGQQMNVPYQSLIKQYLKAALFGP